MNIAIIGYGRMGREVERMALERGHRVVAVVDPSGAAAGRAVTFDSAEFAQADVAIDFSVPTAAAANVRAALQRGVAVVSGTTGWGRELEQLRAEMRPDRPALMWSGNYSLGVNLFFAANRFVARLMAGFPQYTPDVTEVHHVHKLDHPSGTALMAAEQILEQAPGLSGWTEDAHELPGKLLINHVRHGEVPGIHRVVWDSPVDSLALEHSAKSRAGFALGAVMASEWLASKQGGYHAIDEMMDDLISKASRQ